MAFIRLENLMKFELDLIHAHRVLSAQQITITGWVDPLVVEFGWEAGDERTLLYLTPLLGPTATLMLHRLGGNAHSDSTWCVDDLAATFGLKGQGSHGLGKNSPVCRSLARLVQFEFVRLGATSISIRTHVAPLSERHLRHLPPYLVTKYLGDFQRQMARSSP